MKRVIQLSYFWFISVYILAAAAFYGNHTLIFPVVTVLFTILAVLWFRQTNGRLRTGVMRLAGPVILLLSVLIFFFDSSREVLLAYAISAVISVVSARLIYWKKLLGIAGLLLLLPLFVFYVGVPNMRLISTNSGSDALIADSIQKFEMFNSNGSRIEWETHDLIVLDFWHTRCGACFSNFPHLMS
ncbi:MAG: hypothetical protein ABR574_04930 [Cryomorphaceae bacterium]|nr:hypothetical protein [Flavobacteriales bacterium]